MSERRVTKETTTMKKSRRFHELERYDDLVNAKPKAVDLMSISAPKSHGHT